MLHEGCIMVLENCRPEGSIIWPMGDIFSLEMYTECRIEKLPEGFIMLPDFCRPKGSIMQPEANIKPCIAVV